MKDIQLSNDCEKDVFFTFSWGALIVKDMKKRLPPQRKLLLTSKNMSFLINSVCASIQSALLQACSLPPCCCLCFLRHSLPTSLITFPVYLHYSVWDMMQCIRVSTLQSSQYEQWIVRGKFSILATENNLALIGDFMRSFKTKWRLLRGWWL